MRGALAGIVLALVGPGGATAACKLALALGLDVSSSVDDREYGIQLQGLAAAFRTPAVERAILWPEGSAVAVLAYEWSGELHQQVIAGWSLLDSPAAVAQFADRLAAHRRSARSQPTAVGEALRFGAARLAEAPDCARRTLDISGDGANNDGLPPRFYRAQGLLDGIVINGLAIEGSFPNPAEHYEAQVMQGPGSFVVRAAGFEGYPAAILAKLLREIEPELVVGAAR